MSRAFPEAHAEGASAPEVALDGDGPAVRFDELVHERKTDAASLVRAAACAFDAVKTLEHLRQLVLGNAAPRVGDPQLHLRIALAERDLDTPLERELEGVGEEIENELLPHLRVDVDPVSYTHLRAHET